MAWTTEGTRSGAVTVWRISLLEAFISTVPVILNEEGEKAKIDVKCIKSIGMKWIITRISTQATRKVVLKLPDDGNYKIEEK